MLVLAMVAQKTRKFEALVPATGEKHLPCMRVHALPMISPMMYQYAQNMLTIMAHSTWYEIIQLLRLEV